MFGDFFSSLIVTKLGLTALDGAVNGGGFFLVFGFFDAADFEEDELVVDADFGLGVEGGDGFAGLWARW